jgi:vacuolar-type H+-ATPase subunit I/STV1
MAMRAAGHLLKRTGREFVRNVIWLLAIFGLLGAILVYATDLPLLGVAAFVGIFASVMAAIATVVVIWSGAPDETFLSGHNYPGVPHEGGGLDHWPDGGGGEGAVVAVISG